MVIDLRGQGRSGRPGKGRNGAGPGGAAGPGSAQLPVPAPTEPVWSTPVPTVEPGSLTRGPGARGSGGEPVPAEPERTPRRSRSERRPRAGGGLAGGILGAVGLGGAGAAAPSAAAAAPAPAGSAAPPAEGQTGAGLHPSGKKWRPSGLLRPIRQGSDGPGREGARSSGRPPADEPFPVPAPFSSGRGPGRDAGGGTGPGRNRGAGPAEVEHEPFPVPGRDSAAGRDTPFPTTGSISRPGPFPTHGAEAPPDDPFPVPGPVQRRRSPSGRGGRKGRRGPEPTTGSLPVDRFLTVPDGEPFTGSLRLGPATGELPGSSRPSTGGPGTSGPGTGGLPAGRTGTGGLPRVSGERTGSRPGPGEDSGAGLPAGRGREAGARVEHDPDPFPAAGRVGPQQGGDATIAVRRRPRRPANPDAEPDRPGFDQPDQPGFDQQGFDPAGFDQQGFEDPGREEPSLRERTDAAGTDSAGTDAAGYDAAGYDAAGYDEGADAAPARPSRAGRNLVAAIAVGVGLGGAAAASLAFRKEAFVALAAAAVVLGVWELAGALSVKHINVPVIPLAVGSIGMLVSAFVAGQEGLVVAFSLTAFGALLWRVLDGVEGAARDVAAAVFTAAYVPFLAGFALLMLAQPDGARRIVVFILVTVASDVGGYAAGVLFGRHPLAPSVSPKKTWEGFAGSAVTCMAAGTVGVAMLLHGRWWVGLAVGAAAVVTATLGDLSESLLKRDLGVKDMGTLLPGHGGLMDRLDSLLPTAPAVYVLLVLFVSPH